MSPPLLEVRGLTAQLGSRTLLKALDFSVPRGRTLALVGESGSGKSLTALSIMRLLPEVVRVRAGRVRLEGEDLLRLQERVMRRVRGGRIGMIFQEPMTALNPVMTVGAQIAEMARAHGYRRDLRAHVQRLLEEVGMPDARNRLDAWPHQLSGGLKQRVVIAMALAARPDLVIADEPTTALDVTIQAQVLGLLGRLQSQRHLSVLLITHDLGVVAQVAHLVAVMYQGEILERAPVEAFYRRPGHPYGRMLFDALPSMARRGRPLEVPAADVGTRQNAACPYAPRCAWAQDRCWVRAPAWTQIAAGHEVRCHRVEELPAWHGPGAIQSPGARPRDPSTVSPVGSSRASSTVSVSPEARVPLLAVEALKVHFPIRKGLFKRVVGTIRAVDGVSLEIPAATTYALVGESGCGKTTLGKAILQLVRPTAGTVRLAGVPVDRARIGALRRRVQMIFQDPYASLDPRMRVAEILAEGVEALRRRRPDRAQLAGLLEQVGLGAGLLDRYPHEFSGGQRQRIGIARALAVDPELLICDEPTSALDVSVQAQILNLLTELQARRGLAYLFVTHDIAVVEYLADRIGVMYLGRVVEEAPAEPLLRRPRHPYTQALLEAVPLPDPARRRPQALPGDPTSPSALPPGCAFYSRCPVREPRCREQAPGLREVAPGWRVACWRAYDGG